MNNLYIKADKYIYNKYLTNLPQNKYFFNENEI